MILPFISTETDWLSRLKKREEKNESQDKYTRREFSYQSFRRTFTLPETTVDGDKINARYTDGILVITLPKKEEVKPKPPRAIEIW
jgi:heat shock protein Hsp20